LSIMLGITLPCQRARTYGALRTPLLRFSTRIMVRQSRSISPAVLPATYQERSPTR